MQNLRARFEDNALAECYSRGAIKLLSPEPGFALLSTLGGGLCSGDNYSQELELSRSQLLLSSQSNQKIYRGASTLATQISLANSALCFSNDANIIFAGAQFCSHTNIFCDCASSFFYCDGLKFADEFRAQIGCKIFIDAKLKASDYFEYCRAQDAFIFSEFEFFYSAFARPALGIKSIKKEDFILAASVVNGIEILRIFSRSEGAANAELVRIKQAFCQQNNIDFYSFRF